MINKIKKWWQGEFIDSTLEHIFDESETGAAYIKRPPFVKAIIVIGVFLKKEWKWVLGFIATIIGLWIAFLKL